MTGTRPRLKDVIYPSRIRLNWLKAASILPEGTAIKGKVKRGETVTELENETIGENIVMSQTDSEALGVGQYTFILTYYIIEPFSIISQLVADIRIIPEQ